MDALVQLQSPSSEPSPFMEFPRLKARFCLQRAIEDYRAARSSTAADMTMLIVAGVAAGVGSTMGATSAAMDSSHGDKQDLGIASVGLLTGGGALLGLRAALNLGELGRTQRIAAARSVNTAIGILEKYALADDPVTVGNDGFGSCRDEDVNIANAFPSAASAAPIEQVISKAKEAEKQKANEAEAATQKEAKAQSEAVASRVEADRLKGVADDLANKGRGDGPQQVAARTAFLQADAKAAEKEADAKKAQIETLKARLEAAQAELNTSRTRVVEAGGMLRRAVFYLTARDVKLANARLDDAIKNVELAKVRVQEIQKSLDDAQRPSLSRARN